MIQTAAVFSSHMVLQQGKRIAIFGTGTPGEPVHAAIACFGTSVRTAVRADGTWKLYLPKMQGGLTFTMTIFGSENTITFEDVVTGEVWLAGGQSNMEFFLMNAKGGADALKESSHANVRCYNVFRSFIKDAHFEAYERTNCWHCASEETASLWSAVGYWAAKELSEKLGVPVGIIGCNLGGTSASAWMPKEDLCAHAETEIYWKEYQECIDGKTKEEMIAAFDEYAAYHVAWEKRAAECYAEDGNMKWDEVLRRCGENRWPGPMNIKNPLRPCGMYEMMLSRVMPYTVRGFWYYQGESDDHRPDAYFTLLMTMIARWRHDFENACAPFVLVQLPMFCYEDRCHDQNWCMIRETQQRVCDTLRNTALTVTLDCGEFNNIHPTDKQPVAHRLALQTMALVYGAADEAAFAPILRDFSVKDDILTLTFDHAEEGLELHGESGFELAAEEGGYFPAKPEVCGNCVHLRSDAVPVPARARYAWRNYTETTLFGKNGIPAAPLRTCRDESWAI